MDPVVWIIVGVGLFLSAVSLPMWRGWIKPNPLYGFRTPRLVSDPRVWYPANQAMGRDLFFAGLAMAAGIIALGAVTPPGVEPALGLLLAVILAPIVAAVLHGFYVASAFVAELDGIAPPTPAAQADGSKRRAAAAAANTKQRLR